MGELKLLKKIIECDACGEYYQAGSQEFIFDNGWVMKSKQFGYYGGFDDEMFTDEDEERDDWFMCHDCIVVLLETFPKLGATVGKGSHPCEDETPCCQWAWRTSGDTLQFANTELEWVDVGPPV